jgi:hypothetical protein
MNVKTIGNDIVHHPAVAIGVAVLVVGTAAVKAVRK